MIFGQQFAWMNANFACALDRVVARRSASVWRRRVENCCVGSLLRLGRDGSPSWLSCRLLWLVVVGCGCSWVCYANFALELRYFLATIPYEPIRLWNDGLLLCSRTAFSFGS